MRKSELEQRLREADFRISKLTERMEKLEDSSVHKFQEVHQSIEERKSELVNYMDGIQDFSSRQLRSSSDEIYGRLQAFSDEIYGHVAEQNAIRDERFLKLQQAEEEFHDKQGLYNKQEFWMAQFTYDKMIAELQMHFIEQINPGNRKALVSLQNTHAKEKCFVIGNGPSLKAGDLDKIKEKGIFSFASKGIYTIFNQTSWRPDVWGVSDLDYIEIKKDAIDELDGFLKLVCAQSVIARGIQIKDAVYYPFIQAEREPRFFNIDILNGVHFYGTITGKLINFAAYMGFKEIYLLGCDNSWGLKKDSNGRTVWDTSVKAHFSENYYENAKEETYVSRNITDMEKAMHYVDKSYIDIKYFCDELDIKIYNATRGGALEVFERVEFDQMIDK